MPKLMGSKEAADYLGISSSNLDRQVGLPKPHQTLACGRIWLAEDIRLFRKRRRKR